MSALQDLESSQEVIALDQTVDPVFDPGLHFGKWLRALEGFRLREPIELCPGVYLEDDDNDFAAAMNLNDPTPRPGLFGWHAGGDRAR